MCLRTYPPALGPVSHMASWTRGICAPSQIHPGPRMGIHFCHSHEAGLPQHLPMLQMEWLAKDPHFSCPAPGVAYAPEVQAAIGHLLGTFMLLIQKCRETEVPWTSFFLPPHRWMRLRWGSFLWSSRRHLFLFLNKNKMNSTQKKFIPKYFILFEGIVNEIFFKFLFLIVCY